MSIYFNKSYGTKEKKPEWVKCTEDKLRITVRNSGDFKSDVHHLKDQLEKMYRGTHDKAELLGKACERFYLAGDFYRLQVVQQAAREYNPNNPVAKFHEEGRELMNRLFSGLMYFD